MHPFQQSLSGERLLDKRLFSSPDADT